MVKSATTLENVIQYRFTDPGLLRQALTRKSYLEEKQVNSDLNMRPLATLGDAVLDLVVIQELYERGERKVGKIDSKKQKQIRKNRIAEFARGLTYHRYVSWGKGEEKEEIWNISSEAYDTAIEALIGAVYLDAQKNRKNGIRAVAKMLKRLNFTIER